MSVETLTVTQQFTPLDLLLYRRYKREIGGLVEDTLARKRGLATLGPYLPVGTQVTVAIPAPAPSRAPVRVVRLFD